MSNNERLAALAGRGLGPIFVDMINGTMVAISRTDSGYEARSVPRKSGVILVQDCKSEQAAVLAVALVLELEDRRTRATEQLIPRLHRNQ